MMTGKPTFSNPYVGPRPFEQNESGFFFGREEETKILSGLVVAHQLSLFYAQSGAGKSSLLRAGLLPRLTRKTRVGHNDDAYLYQRMRVLPIVTVGRGVPPSTTDAISNIYVFSALLGLFPDADPNNLTAQSLVDALTPLIEDGIEPGATWEPAQERDGRVRPPLIKPDVTLLIIDQFEEIFTAHPERWQDREDFFRQIDQTLTRFPLLHILLTQREDYLAELTPFANLLTDNLRHRFRMERLRSEGALLAITQPAQAAYPPRTFAPGVAEALIDNLRRVQSSRHRAQQTVHGSSTATDGIAHTDSERTPTYGEYIEPVQLQIVCHDLWEGLPPEQTAIHSADLQTLGDVDQALTNFYESALKRVVSSTDVSERALRNWFGQELITSSHTRGLVYSDTSTGATEGMPNAAVDILRDVYIIRADVRGGDIWFELAHDRLVEPILASNSNWLAAYFNPLSAPQQRWQASGRIPAKLLDGQQLREAQTFAANKPGELTEDERDYLDASVRQAALDAELDRQRKQRRRFMFTLAIVIFLVLSVLTAWALHSANEAKIARQIADDEREAALYHADKAKIAQDHADAERETASSRELAAASMVNLDVDPERSLLLALHALAITHTLQAEGALHEAVAGSRTEQTLHGHTGEVIGVAYSPDNDRFFSASWDGTLKIWDRAGGVEEMTLDGEGGRMHGFDVSHDGDLLITAQEDGSAQIWNAHSGALIRRIDSHKPRVHDVAFSPDGSRFATASGDMTAKLWDTATGESLQTLHGHRNEVWSVAFHPDGHLIATAAEDGLVKLWDVETGEEIATLAIHDDGVQDIEFSPSGELLATASWDYTAKIVDMATLAVVQTLSGHENWVRAVSFSTDGERIATGSWDRSAKIWDVDSGRELIMLRGHTDWINDVAFGNDDSQLATASADQTLRLWNAGASREVFTYDQHNAAVSGIDVHPTEAIVASTDRAGFVHLWDLNTGESIYILDGHTGPVTDVAFSADGDLIATAGEDRSVRLWDTETGTQLMPPLTSHRVPVLGVAFSPDSAHLVSVSADESMKLWRVADGEELHSVSAHSSRVNDVVFSPDGRQIVTVSGDRMAKVWDPMTGELDTEWKAHERQLRAVDISPDGQLVATSSDDQTAKIWATDTSTEVLSLIDHIDRVQDVAFSNDGELVATASWDGSSKVWDATTGFLRLSLHGHLGRVFEVAFSADDRLLLSGSEDGTVRVHLLDVDALSTEAKTRVTRSLTENECATYLHTQPCPELP